MIKAIIFDWGGVLINSPNPGIISYCAKYLHIPEETFEKVSKKYKQDFQMGKISEDEFWNKICLDLKIQKPSILSLWREALIKSYIEKKEIIKIVINLKNNGYKIGILSNTEKPAVDFFYEKKYNMFDALVFSCNVGVRKPYSDIYKLILKELNVRPKEAVLIDDKKENIIGAKNIGMHSILYVNKSQLVEQLFLLNVFMH
jgi:putative hydrolase of the HAD superfamily